jgi:hypothetical protein
MGKAKSEKEASPPRPVCKAILLCDQTILEAGTGKLSLIGIFSNFIMENLPGQIPKTEAFVQITDAKGRYDIVVEIHDLREDIIIARGKGLGIDVPNRHFFCNVLIPVPQLLIKHDGKYDIVVIANDEEIDRQQFDVIKR